MGKGNLGRREGSGDHRGLLSTGSGELSIKLALDHSQAILVRLPMPYDGDDQSRCHKWTEENILLVACCVAQRQTRRTRPGDGSLAKRNARCCKWELLARPERVSSSSTSTCNSNAKTKQKLDLNPLEFGKSKSLFFLHRRRSAFQVNGIGRDNVPLFAHCRCPRRPGCLSSFSGRH